MNFNNFMLSLSIFDVKIILLYIINSSKSKDYFKKIGGYESGKRPYKNSSRHIKTS